MATEYKDLAGFFDKSKCYCLNASPTHGLQNLFNTDPRSVLKSEDDEQLLICIQFNTMVKIHSIAISAPDDDSAPRRVKLFVNETSMNFGDTDSSGFAQALDLTPEDLAEDRTLPLRFVKFQRVHAITLFVEENAGGETTTISNLRFFGDAVATADVTGLKKVGEEE